MIRKLLEDRRTRRTEENVEKLREAIAQHDADHTYHARMAGFYRDEMESIEPYSSPEDAQRFATAFRKRRDEEDDMQRAMEASREANARLEALV